MIRAALLLLVLAGCGVEGPPLPPLPRDEPPAAQPGVTVSGTAEIGVIGAN